MRSLLLTLPALAAVLGGCSSIDDNSDTEATSRVTTAEVERARAITGLVKGRCSTCHTAGKTDLQRWGRALQDVQSTCLAPALALTPAQRVDCLRHDPADPTSAFTQTKLGFYAAATTHTSFRTLFAQAGAAYDTFTRDASMPPIEAAAPRYSESEFASLEKWVLDGMPALDEAMVESGATCVPFVSPELADHVAASKSSGWAARHAEASLPMFGCSENSGNCLTSHPDVTSTWAEAGVPQTLRKLYELPFATYAWTRSSADGRFAAFGGTPAKVVDLAAPGGPRPIDVAARFDPAFFPDNSGFAFANTSGSRVSACRQSVLLNAATAPSASISLTEPGCSSMRSTDYQAIGAALDGSLYLMASGTHENDVTFALPHGPLSGAFSAEAFTNLLPMLSDGTTYVERPRVTLAHPFEGDGGLSPSTQLLYTRFGTAAGRRGYRIRKLTPKGHVSPAPGQAALTIETKELATVCSSGAKPMGSYDERFLVTHQYVDPVENPGLPNNSANVVLFDLATGETIRLTHLARGEYAFSPVFRADGWIYFLVRDANTRKETFVASDAAVRRLAQPPR